MKVYKDKQFLVFDFEDGKTVKYDFATKECIGKKGKIVQGLHSQLRGYDIDEICDCCTDKQYGKFLKWLSKKQYCSNIGTVLSRVTRYQKYEQFFSAGIEDFIARSGVLFTINDIPKSLIKLCKEKKIILDDNFLKFYKENPDGYLLAYNLKYISLTDRDITNTLSRCTYNDGEREGYFNKLIKDYGYTAKALMLYLDELKTYEALDNIYVIITELYDYAYMMKQISPKFDKYPRNFLTTHQIASRNYNRLKKEFVEKDFQKRIDKNMERTFGKYRFYYPDSTESIKREATMQNNCVASYIDKVIKGDCNILFLRYKEKPDESLVTIEVRNDKNGIPQICQARQKFNAYVTEEQQKVIDDWNQWQINKNKNTNESEGIERAS